MSNQIPHKTLGCDYLYMLLSQVNNVWHVRELAGILQGSEFNTLRPRQGRHHFSDIFKCIFLNENVWLPIKISLKFVPKGPINNIPALVQIMAWRRPGDKSSSEPMVYRSLMHLCVTRPQWVNVLCPALIAMYIYVVNEIYLHRDKN